MWPWSVDRKLSPPGKRLLCRHSKTGVHSLHLPAPAPHSVRALWCWGQPYAGSNPCCAAEPKGRSELKITDARASAQVLDSTWQTVAESRLSKPSTDCQAS